MRQSYHRTAMLWFGIVMAVIGVLGFITQGATSGHHLLGLFYVDSSFNTIFTVTGVLGIVLAFTSDMVVRTYFKVVAIVYAVWAIIGLFSGSGQVLGFINNNGWDVALTAIVALISAGFGWSEARELGESRTRSSNDAVAFGEYQDGHRRDRR